eukprot:Seg1309.1 transcript_id=Seg1309.1/GoldUCD/mRNA.D3Y31 product="ATP-dependent helicase SGS1" protein_id=Seg1309.1/GoldUCD/D3Y31
MKAIEIAKAMFNIAELKEYQTEALIGLLQGRDVVVAQPTGSGKSLVYQLIPFVVEIFNILQNESIVDAMEKDRLIQAIFNTKKTRSAVLVIQPLIALMGDEIHSMEHRQIKVCRLMHISPSCSTVNAQTESSSLTSAKSCDASIIIASPEAILRTQISQLRSDSVSKRIIRVAVDE